MRKSKNSIDDYLNNITPEEQAKINNSIDAHIKYMNEHPDYNKRYGTDKSYWLEEIKLKGFNPIGITIMTCEETIIMKTQEELERAWEIFKPEGWWYTIDQWEKVRQDYIKDMYEGDKTKAPLVYCLNDKFNNILSKI
jgi:hypothetical protein